MNFRWNHWTCRTTQYPSWMYVRAEHTAQAQGVFVYPPVNRISMGLGFLLLPPYQKYKVSGESKVSFSVVKVHSFRRKVPSNHEQLTLGKVPNMRKKPLRVIQASVRTFICFAEVALTTYCFATCNAFDMDQVRICLKSHLRAGRGEMLYGKREMIS